MASNLRHIENDSEFDPELSGAGTRLVVVDFFATWCGPCHRIAPVFQQYCSKYPKALFLKVDVDKCPDTAAKEGVSAMPTFIFYQNKTKIDSLRGADPNALEEKIKKWYGEGEEENGEEVLVKGHMDLSSFINKSGCECLNEADDHPLAHCLTAKGGYLESDCDEQLLISIEFTQPVKLHSLRLQAPSDKGPKTIKVFQNQPRSLDFDSADSMEPTQTLEISEKDLKESELLSLRYVKFQNVTNITLLNECVRRASCGGCCCLQQYLAKQQTCKGNPSVELSFSMNEKLFIKDNLGGEETTQMDYLGFIGSPVTATNMSDFKRVAGKKGESH